MRVWDMKQSDTKNLDQIPGVGKRTLKEMQNIGINSIDQLEDQDPQKLYEKLCDIKASPPDRCLLYVLRCAVYYASNTEHDPELLQWWNWKDKNS
jgi:hypothetical protein